MDTISYNQLQLREAFHLEFLRWLGRKVKGEYYAVKGGVNLRFFFKSFRYSEDMDLDVRGIKVIDLKEAVMKILDSAAFRDNLKPFGIERIIAPNIAVSKQTETTQRFKVHLVSAAGVDLFTKIEFSRRGFAGNAVVESVSDTILRIYKLPPLLVPHYDIHSTVSQKIRALAGRRITQARDIFDLYVLSSQYDDSASAAPPERPDKDCLSKARDNILEISFGVFRDTVVSYFSVEDQEIYNKPSSWEEVRLKTAAFVERFR